MNKEIAGVRKRRGYSLIEMVGVMAIIAILATAIIPSVVKQMDQAARSREITDLTALAAGLNAHVLRSQNIPSYTNWSSALMDTLTTAPSSLLFTSRGNARAFWIDPNIQIGGGGLPYNQGINGSPNPVNARILIVSTLGVPLPITSGIPTSIAFAAVWNSPTGSIPTNWTTWKGTGQDLVIQRISLASLFHRLILVNADSARVGKFSINGASPASVTNNGVGTDAYYLDGTVVGLHDNTGALQNQAVLTRDMSYVFESGAWQPQLQQGKIGTSVTNLSSVVSQFLAATVNPSALNTACQEGVVDYMWTYMWCYTQWANDSPCFVNSQGSGISTPNAQNVIMTNSMYFLTNYAAWLAK